MEDETLISLVINGEYISMPIPEAHRVYRRLGELIPPEDDDNA